MYKQRLAGHQAGMLERTHGETFGQTGGKTLVPHSSCPLVEGLPWLMPLASPALYLVPVEAGNGFAQFGLTLCPVLRDLCA